LSRSSIWSPLRVMRPEDAWLHLVVPHIFRVIGLSFLSTWGCSPSLQPGFAKPAAYGDLVAAILATLSTLALSLHVSWAVAIVWIFNIWGTADLLHAIYQGQIRLRIGPESLGAAFFTPTVVVPPLLITHGLIFRLLLLAKLSPRCCRKHRRASDFSHAGFRGLA
jgi:hypothetical protein